MGKRTRKNKAEEIEDDADTTASEEVDASEGEEVRRDRPDDLSDIDPGVDPRDPEGEDGRRSRVMRFAKRLMDRRELSTDTREILGNVLATSDKAKTEAVRMVAREVRSYLDALELKDDFKELITSYSLEISLSLKPLEPVVADGRMARADTAPEGEEASEDGQGDEEDEDWFPKT